MISPAHPQLSEPNQEFHRATLPEHPRGNISSAVVAGALSEQSVLFDAGRSEGLAREMCAHLSTQSGKLILSKFPNTETRIEVHESVRDRHVFIVASMSPPINDSFFNTVLLIQALKLADARRITVILPYFPYSRQDRKADIRPPISAKVVTDILKVVGGHQIVTVDLHATQVEGFFDGPFENLSGLNQIVPHLLSEEGNDLIIVSPDAGGAKRAENFARQIERLTGEFAPLVVMSKIRSGHDRQPRVTMSAGPEVLQGKTCVLVDDMIDTGGSIIAAANALKEKGAARVVVCATHAVFSNNAVDKLFESVTEQGRRSIDKVFVTNTVPFRNERPEVLRVIDLSPLLAEAIRRLDRSMGTLRELKERTDLGAVIVPHDIVVKEIQ